MSTQHDIDAYVVRPFGTFSDLVRLQARFRPEHTALIQDERRVSYAEFDALVDQVAASLQRDGVGVGEVVSACAFTSIEYAAVFVATLRAGAAIAPLAPSSTAESLATMLDDCGAKLLLLDRDCAATLAPVSDRIEAARVSLDGSDAGRPFYEWLEPEGAKPAPIEVRPEAPFNIIYSSGTTGAPKGIVQSHQMRWAQISRNSPVGYGPDGVALISTPLYSNTTLVSFIPCLAGGGTAVLMAKFDAGRWLELAERHRVTHAMLVPVQYRRILEHPDFDRRDLSSFVMKFATSAPFAASLKEQVLNRWPGGLIEYFGMTEGGGSCWLVAHEHPDKLHTVGQPMPGHDIRIIGEDGRELPAGEVGEIVGCSPAIMNGYHNKPDKTAEAEWFAPDGRRFIRTGDVGRFDAEGFLTLMDRKKDMIISGGFNVYPSDLEQVLLQHPAVVEAAVVGVASEQWGETPVAFVTVRERAPASADAVRAWANERLGKTQRLADVVLVDQLPRSHIGKVLKRDLRDGYAAAKAAPVT
jgi:long-chain acyl-CoA synthetase